ncbi:acyl-CoA dehydrogenase [soil metagenome]
MVLSDQLRIALDGKWREVREQSRKELADFDLLADPYLTLDEARDRVLEQMKLLGATGIPAAGFGTDHGGTGNPGRAVTGIEMLAQFDLSLMVKSGVQWGLFGGAIENLGTEHHHKTYVPDLINLDLLGCFAMTETGHGSDVQSLETTATYDPETHEFVIHSPTPSARKDYIGGAAKHATLAAVFAQLVTQGKSHGVHCFLVPLRDENGNDLPGITTSDCGYKGGLAGVDNGRIMFDQVRIPRINLLNRYGDVDDNGDYSSPIDNTNKRFFTMLGTLIRGRVSVGGSANAAAQVALSIAGRYALQRRQFSNGDGKGEVVLMDYRMHQRRLLPLIARSYALQFAQNQLVARMHRLQTADEPDPQLQREVESRAAGIKAVATWHATRAIQECREACGGAGYLTENRLTTLKADTDVFTTFEGDNHVLLQLVAKELLTAYSAEVRGLDPFGIAKFAVSSVADVVKERTAAQQLIQRLLDARPGADENYDLLNRGTQLALFEDREQHVLETAAKRLRRAGKDKAAAFKLFNAAQDHIIDAGRVHIDRVVLEAFTAGIARCEDPEAQDVLRDVCSLYALSIIEDDKAWFMEHNRLTVARAKAVSREINELLHKLRPLTLALIEGFGVPEKSLGAAMLEPVES